MFECYLRQTRELLTDARMNAVYPIKKPLQVSRRIPGVIECAGGKYVNRVGDHAAAIVKQLNNED